jgi:hypothetical protein
MQDNIYLTILFAIFFVSCKENSKVLKTAYKAKMVEHLNQTKNFGIEDISKTKIISDDIFDTAIIKDEIILYKPYFKKNTDKCLRHDKICNLTVLQNVKEDRYYYLYNNYNLFTNLAERNSKLYGGLYYYNDSWDVFQLNNIINIELSHKSDSTKLELIREIITIHENITQEELINDSLKLHKIISKWENDIVSFYSKNEAGWQIYNNYKQRLKSELIELIDNKNCIIYSKKRDGTFLFLYSLNKITNTNLFKINRFAFSWQDIVVDKIYRVNGTDACELCAYSKNIY